MLEIIYLSQFKKDSKKYKNNEKCKEAVREVICLLQNKKSLPEKFKEHKLSGDYMNYLECHCKPDLLLIYQKTTTSLILYRLGSHSELF